MRNRLERCKFRSIDLGHFKANITEIKDLNSVVDLYGNCLSSYTWKQNENITKIIVNLELYQVYTIDSIKNSKGESLKIYAPGMFIEHVLGILNFLISNRIMPDGELCNFCDCVRGQDILVYPYSEVPDFWWDIYNGFFMFFGDEKEHLIISALEKMKKSSLDDLEQVDWDELSRYYYLANSDLDEEALEFLKPKKRILRRQLINILKEGIKQKTDEN